MIGNHKGLGQWNIAGALPLYLDGYAHTTHAFITEALSGELDVEYTYALVRFVYGERIVVAWAEGNIRVLRQAELGSDTGVTDHVRSWRWTSDHTEEV